MELVTVYGQSDHIPRLGFYAGRDRRRQAYAVIGGVDGDLGAGVLGELYPGVDLDYFAGAGVGLGQVYVLGADAQGNLFVRGGFAGGDGQGYAPKFGVGAALGLSDCGVDEVHLGGSNETRHEEVTGLGVEVLRRVHLLDVAVFHDHDAVPHGHGLNLIVGDVDEGGL